MARVLSANEQTALGTSVAAGAAHARTWVRLEVQDAEISPSWVDLSNMFHGARWGTDVDRTVIAGTIYLSRSHTDTADTLSPLITDGLDAGRPVRLYMTTLPHGVTPAPEDLQLVLDGIIKSVHAAGEIIECQVRDRIGAILADRDMVTHYPIYQGVGSGPDGGTSLESILDQLLYQAALDNNAATGLDHDIPTDFDASGSYVAAGDPNSTEILRFEGGKLLELLRSVADRIGWQLRPRWNEADGEFQLAFYEPDHDKSTVDWIVPPSRLLDFTQLDIDDEHIRNAIKVSYINEDGDRVTYPTAPPVGYSVPVVVDEDSIARFGFRYMELSFEIYDPIRTEADAAAIIAIALAELAWPVVDATASLMLNWAVDVDDRITFGADDVRFDEDQTWAVVGYEHNTDPGTERTLVQVRGKPSGGVTRWRNPPKAPANVLPPEDLVLESDHTWMSQGDFDMIAYRIVGTFTPSPDAFLDHYDLQYKQKLATEWIAAPPPPKDATDFVITGAIGLDVYSVRIRAVNTRGFASAWVAGEVVVGFVSGDHSGIRVDLRYDTAGQLIADITGPTEWGYFLWDADDTAQPAAGMIAPPTAYTPGTLYTLNTGLNVPVEGIGYLTLDFYEDSSGAVAGPQILKQKQRTTPFTPPSVEATPSQSGSTGTLTLTITDPMLAITAVEYSRKTGTGDFDAFTSTGWDTSTGTIGTDADLVRARNITLSTADHNVGIRWRVTYDAPGGVEQTLGGSHSFDSDLVANVTNIDITFSTTGEINVSAVGDEDTANMYANASAGGTPSDPTNSVHHASIAGRSGADNTGVTCASDQVATVKVRGYNASGVAGPVLTASVVRPNVATIARASTTETIRATTAPTTRVGGTALIQGDMWIDTDAGNKPYIWSGVAWVAAYTSIDGSAITTGAISSIIYTPGSAGWTINTNGAVEFNSGTFRGAIDATAFNLKFGGTTVGQFQMNSTGFALVGSGMAVDFDFSGGVGSEIVTVTALGGVNIGAGEPIKFPAIATTASAANAVLNLASGNELLRSTSSERYKNQIRTLDAAEARKTVLGLTAIGYHSTAQIDDPDREFIGLSAEEVHKVDARLVHLYEGEPDGVMYERVVVLNTVIIQDHEKRIAELERQLAELGERAGDEQGANTPGRTK